MAFQRAGTESAGRAQSVVEVMERLPRRCGVRLRQRQGELDERFGLAVHGTRQRDGVIRQAVVGRVGRGGDQIVAFCIQPGARAMFNGMVRRVVTAAGRGGLFHGLTAMSPTQNV